MELGGMRGNAQVLMAMLFVYNSYAGHRGRVPGATVSMALGGVLAREELAWMYPTYSYVSFITIPSALFRNGCDARSQREQCQGSDWVR